MGAGIITEGMAYITLCKVTVARSHYITQYYYVMLLFSDILYIGTQLICLCLIIVLLQAKLVFSQPVRTASYLKGL